jgi:hypothetical protein
MTRRYCTSGDCNCRPWKESSFCLFGTFYSEDKDKEIKFCPWCGSKLTTTQEVIEDATMRQEWARDDLMRVAQEIATECFSIEGFEGAGVGMEGIDSDPTNIKVVIYLEKKKHITIYNRIKETYPEVPICYNIVGKCELH